MQIALLASWWQKLCTTVELLPLTYMVCHTNHTDTTTYNVCMYAMCVTLPVLDSLYVLP